MTCCMVVIILLLLAVLPIPSADSSSCPIYSIQAQNGCQCLAGYVKNATVATMPCFKCPEGSYSLSGDSACTLCPANSNSLAGACSCVCNNGWTQSGTGHTLTCAKISATASPALSCLAGYTLNEDLLKCYKYASVSNTWLGAAAYCSSDGLGHLATIDSAEESKYVGSLCAGSSYFCWIGLSDLAVNGAYTWLYGTSSVRNFDVGQPDTFRGVEHCVGVWGPLGVSNMPANRHLGYWNDFNCTLTTGQTICESEPFPLFALNASGVTQAAWPNIKRVIIPENTIKRLPSEFIFDNLHVILKGTIVGAQYSTLVNGTKIDIYPSARWATDDEHIEKVGTIIIANLTLLESTNIKIFGGNITGSYAKLYLRNIDVSFGASLTSTGLGYPGSKRLNYEPSQTYAGGSSTFGDGGYHAGPGGGSQSLTSSTSNSAITPICKDTFDSPSEMGSGGGASSMHDGASGGGVVYMNVLENVFLYGSISADGAPCLLGSEGGGAGGSINLDAYNLVGLGSISAIGGNGCTGSVGSGGGSGGRVSVKTHRSFEYEGVFLVHPGFNGAASIRPSSGGTLYLSFNDGQGSYLTSNGGGQVWLCGNGSIDVNEIVIRDTSMLVSSGSHISSSRLFKTQSSSLEIETASRRLNEISPAAGSTLPAGGLLQLGSPWPTLGRNSFHTHNTPLRSGPNALSRDQNWIFLPGWYGANFTFIARSRLSQPVIDKIGVLYYGFATYVIAMNTITNTLSWRYDFGCLMWGALTIGADGTIYGTCDDTRNRPNYLFALYPWGALKWKMHIDGSRSTPMIASGGTIYFTSSRSCCILAVRDDIDFASSLWSLCSGVYPKTCQYGGGYSSATQIEGDSIQTKIVVAGSGGFISGILDTHGNDIPSVMWKFNTSGAVHSTPIVSSTTVFIGCDDSYLYALNATNGSFIWKFKTGASVFQASPALANNMVFIGSGDSILYALSADSGKLLWSRSIIGNLQMSSPVIGGDGSLYLTTYSSGLLLSINSVTGNLYWSSGLNGDASSVAIGADGSLYLFTSGSNVYSIGKDNSCPSGLAIPLNFSSSDESYSCSKCPNRYAPTGGSCIFCGSNCPLQPFKIPDYFVVAPQRCNFLLMAGASLDLISSLNVSGFDVYLKTGSSVRCNGYVSIDGNSTLHMERGSQLLSHEFQSQNISFSIAVNDLNIVNGVLKIKTDGIESKFQILASVFNIFQQGAFHGFGETSCSTAVMYTPTTTLGIITEIKQMLPYCLAIYSFTPGVFPGNGLNLEIESNIFSLNGTLNLFGSDGGNGGSLTIMTGTFTGTGVVNTNGSTAPLELTDYMHDSSLGLPGNVFLNVTISNTFTGKYNP